MHKVHDLHNQWAKLERFDSFMKDVWTSFPVQYSLETNTTWRWFSGRMVPRTRANLSRHISEKLANLSVKKASFIFSGPYHKICIQDLILPKNLMVMILNLNCRKLTKVAPTYSDFNNWVRLKY